MAILYIDGKKFEYDDIHLSYDSISAMNLDIAKELLLKVKRIFDNRGLKFELVFGTLLGAVRDKSFIKGDEDIDICVRDEKELIRIIPELYANNIKICRINKNSLYSFMYIDGCYIDVYILCPYKYSLFGIYCFNLAGYAIPKKYLRQTLQIDFFNEIFNCPKEPEKILEFWYGESWRIPQFGHNYLYEIYISYAYKKIKYYIKSMLKFLLGYKYWQKRS